MLLLSPQDEAMWNDVSRYVPNGVDLSSSRCVVRMLNYMFHAVDYCDLTAVFACCIDRFRSDFTITAAGSN